MTNKFGSLTKDEKKALMCAYVDGAEIQHLAPSDVWKDIVEPAWCHGVTYRIKPRPPVVQTFSVFGGWYDKNKTCLYFDSEDEGDVDADYKITVSVIDGVVQPNAKVEKL